MCRRNFFNSSRYMKKCGVWTFFSFLYMKKRGAGTFFFICVLTLDSNIQHCLIIIRNYTCIWNSRVNFKGFFLICRQIYMIDINSLLVSGCLKNSSSSPEKNTYVIFSDRNIKVEFHLDQNSHY